MGIVSRTSVFLTIATLLALAGSCLPASSQLVREHDAASSRSFHGDTTRIRRSFRSDAEARAVLKQVLEAAGLAGMEDRITLRASAETANAEAVVEREERLIFYNAVYMQDVARKAGDYWSKVAVLAHELGHHIRLHTVISGRNHEFELEADYQAGFIMRRMGAMLEQAQAFFRTLPEAATPTHPGRDQRVQMVTLGWTDGGPRQAPAETQPPAVANPPPTSTQAFSVDLRVIAGRAATIDRCGVTVASRARATHEGQGIYSSRVDINGTESVIRGNLQARPQTEKGSCQLSINLRASGDLQVTGTCRCSG